MTPADIASIEAIGAEEVYFIRIGCRSATVERSCANTRMPSVRVRRKDGESFVGMLIRLGAALEKAGPNVFRPQTIRQRKREELDRAIFRAQRQILYADPAKGA
jgi:hypothetical protein